MEQDPAQTDPDAAPLDLETAAALLAWQVELGATEAIGAAPLDRYALAAEQAAKARARAAEGAPNVPARAAPPPPPPQEPDPVEMAHGAAEAAQDLAALRAALAAFEGAPSKRGARNMVFAEGQPGARIMVIGGIPSRESDRSGRPWDGAAGRLLDRMLAAIGLSREAEDPGRGAYLVESTPWRPVAEPDAGELAAMRPFLARHVALAGPEILLPMGPVACQMVLGRTGLSRLRGSWTEGFGKPALPMLHPERLLKTPAAKAQAWADLLELKARLERK